MESVRRRLHGKESNVPLDAFRELLRLASAGESLPTTAIDIVRFGSAALRQNLLTDEAERLMVHERVFLAALECHNLDIAKQMLTALEQRFPSKLPQIASEHARPPSSQLFLSPLTPIADEEKRAASDQLVDDIKTRATQALGNSSARVGRLQAMFAEATGQRTLAQSQMQLLIDADQTALPVLKRRIALQLSSPEPQALSTAISMLVQLLSVFSGDESAWLLLADLYERLCRYPESRYCLEECVLLHPDDFRLHCRLGEVCRNQSLDVFVWISLWKSADVSRNGRNRHRQIALLPCNRIESIMRTCHVRIDCGLWRYR